MDETGEAKNLPVLYVTDGQWYIDRGEMSQVIDELIEDGEIDPVTRHGSCGK